MSNINNNAKSTQIITPVSQLDPRKIFGVLCDDLFMKSQVAHIPFIIEAQPTDVCNFACQYCSYTLRRKKSKYTSWDLSTAVRFIDFLQEEPTSVLYISGGGEPLVWKYMPFFLKRLSIIDDLTKILITNGALIGKRIPLKLLQDFSLIIISIASIIPEIYSQTMRGLAIKPETLKHILNLPSLFPKPRPDLNACVIVTESNDRYLDRVAIELIGYGFDFVYFKAGHNYEESGNRLSNKRRDLIVKAKYDLPPYVAERTNLQTFISDCDQKEANIIDKKLDCINLKYMLRVIITAIGDIYTCIPRVGNPQYSLGNIRTSKSMLPLRKLFNNQELNEKILKEYQAGLCGRCHFKKYNEIAIKVTKEELYAIEKSKFKHPYFL